MGKDSDKYRGQIANEFLEVAGSLGLNNGDFLHADGCEPRDYSTRMMVEDAELLAQRARQVESAAQLIYAYVRKIGEILNVEKDLKLFAREIGPKEYALEHAVHDLKQLESNARAVRHNLESSARERTEGLKAAMLLNILINQ